MAIFSPETLDEGYVARKKIVGRPVFPVPFDPGLVPGMPHYFIGFPRIAEIPVFRKRGWPGVPPKRGCRMIRHPDSGGWAA
jgi:hypothetical protein